MVAKTMAIDTHLSRIKYLLKMLTVRPVLLRHHVEAAPSVMSGNGALRARCNTHLNPSLLRTIFITDVMSSYHWRNSAPVHLLLSSEYPQTRDS
mmetsp:Transcript_10537/g.19040  ORF Transcript_10537/g.19040 Transcript_10537/m.19040 type:complete len:94 (+) Transcript_10537:18-299(+)